MSNDTWQLWVHKARNEKLSKHIHDVYTYLQKKMEIYCPFINNLLKRFLLAQKDIFPPSVYLPNFCYGLLWVNDKVKRMTNQAMIRYTQSSNKILTWKFLNSILTYIICKYIFSRILDGVLKNFFFYYISFFLFLKKKTFYSFF